MLKDLNVNWKAIVFTDEKKFNLSGSDFLIYYWNDFCQNPDKIECESNCREGLMVWNAISDKDIISLEGAVGTIDTDYYIAILGEGPLPALMRYWTIFELYNTIMLLFIQQHRQKCGPKRMIYMSWTSLLARRT